MAVELHQFGRPLVFSGVVAPERWEPLPLRAYVTTIYYLALVCDPEVHEERLRGRGPGSMDDYYFPRVLSHNRWLLANAATTTPAIDVLDTTQLGPHETALAVADSVRDRLPPHLARS